jgi:hypothetical protein
LWKGGTIEDTDAYGGPKKGKIVLLKQSSNILSKEMICG